MDKRYYKFLAVDGTSPFAAYRYALPAEGTIGEWTPEERPVLCWSGWHVLSAEQVGSWIRDVNPSGELWEVETRGNHADDGHKSAWTSIRLLHRVGRWVEGDPLFEAVATAGAAYDQAVATARAAYDQAVATAGAAYDQAVATAGAAYDQAVATAGAAYDQAVAPARAAYREAAAPARAAYAQAVATALKEAGD